MSDDHDHHDGNDDHELRVSKIRDGTVIDHVHGGQA